MHSHSPQLAALIARSRATIFGPPTAPAVQGQEAARKSTEAREPLPLPQEVLGTFQRPQEAPAAHILPTFPTAAEVLGDRKLSRGAAHIWNYMHALAVHVAQVQGFGVVPSSVTFHLPAVILAALAEYSERHTYTLADELRAAGLIDERGHVTDVGKLRRYDGTLWSVALKPTARPRLRWFDFRHDWRPDFAEDYHGEQGAFRAVQAVISEPLTSEGRLEELFHLAKTWAAATKTRKNPVEGGSEVRPAGTLRAVADAVPGILHLHPRQRHREVSRLAADLAHALGEPGRFRQHCATLYAALQAENEGRYGLQALQTALYRLAADMAEGAPWKKPGAILAARLR